MGGRAFDPAFLGIVDQGHFAEVDDCLDDDFTLAERCPICGTDDLLFDPEREALVTLEGEPHACPAE